uniref:Uncharacterized protein n=1 Tax=Glossina pallidipes TaxID=7398 RepID=A0A1A9ZV90_GLOPL
MAAQDIIGMYPNLLHINSYVLVTSTSYRRGYKPFAMSSSTFCVTFNSICTLVWGETCFVASKLVFSYEATCIYDFDRIFLKTMFFQFSPLDSLRAQFLKSEPSFSYQQLGAKKCSLEIIN